MNQHYIKNILFIFVCIFLFRSDAGAHPGVFNVDSATIKIDSTQNLILYSPKFSDIDLVCEIRPDSNDRQLLFCAEAAFTGRCVDSFYHYNIAGDHFSGGICYEGYDCNANKGGFIYYKNHHWKFLEKEAYNHALRDTAHIQCSFEQGLLVFKGEIFRPYLMKPSRKEIYRALCETEDGKLVIVTNKDKIPYEQFVNALVHELHARYALYMDMGDGWNYAWFRNEDGTFTDIFPQTKYTAYQTNWLIFKR